MADLMEQYANVSSFGGETTYVNAPNNDLEIVRYIYTSILCFIAPRHSVVVLLFCCV